MASFAELFKTTVPEFPCTVGADITFRIGLPAFTIYSLFNWYINFVRHSYITLTIVTTITLVLFALTIAAFSYRLRIDDDGLHFSWIMGKRSAAWKDIVRIERTKSSYALYNKDNQEVVPLSVIPFPIQKAIADKVMTEVKMKQDASKQKYPVLEQWKR